MSSPIAGFVRSLFALEPRRASDAVGFVPPTHRIDIGVHGMHISAREGPAPARSVTRVHDFDSGRPGPAPLGPPA